MSPSGPDQQAPEEVAPLPGAANRARDRDGAWTTALVTAIIVDMALTVMPWESLEAMGFSFAMGMVAGALAFLGVRRGGRALRATLFGGAIGGVLGILASGALLYLPAFSEDETRPVDWILGAVILGFYLAGGIWAGFATRERRSNPPGA
ncbi:MAG: hypothetical protein HY720_25805 [Planctomycetes bacterium]|nr:hypothetical protein [Planctomycetota bacterium]